MTKRLRRWALVLAAAGLVGSPAAAWAGFGYTYLEAGAGYTDTQGGDGGGLIAGLSAAVNRHAHLFAGYRQIGGDNGFAIGAGAKFSANPRLDLVGRVGFVDLAVANGPTLELGLRARTFGNEVNGGFTWSSLDFGDEAGVFAGVVAPIARRLGLFFSVATSANVTSVAAGFRAYI